MLSDVQSILSSYRFAWYGQRASDCVGMDKYFNVDLILSCDYGMDTPYVLSDTKSEIMSIEQDTFIRENWTSGYLDLLIEKQRENLQAYVLADKKPLCVIAYSATKSLADFAGSLDGKVKVVMPNPSLRTKLDSKFFFRGIISELNLPMIHGSIKDLAKLSYERTASNLGARFVISQKHGSAGSGTFFVNNEKDWNKFVAQTQGQVLLTEYIRGLTLNINAAVVGDQVIIMRPSVQLVGIKECTYRPEVYCGNDFHALRQIPSQTISQATDHVRKIGLWLNKMGYQGIYGVDLVVDLSNGIVYPVDLNPRFQNSTHLLTQMELDCDRMPLVIRYIMHNLGLIDLTGNAPEVSQDCTLDGAQIIVHSLSNTSTTVTGKLLPGIYTSVPHIKRIRDGWSFSDLKAENEFLLTCAVPRPGTIIRPGAPLYKIIARQQMFDLDKLSLLPWIQNAIKVTYGQLEIG